MLCIYGDLRGVCRNPVYVRKEAGSRQSGVLLRQHTAGARNSFWRLWSYPYAIADTDGKILWMNRAFEAVTRREERREKPDNALQGEITVESLEKMENAMEVHGIYGESKYRVSMKRVTIRPDELASGIPEKQTEQQILAVYLYDETELYNYKQAITDQRWSRA